jgi:uncharacterized OB-fold protein
VADDSGVLSAPLIIEYPFSRTTGPVIGAFLTGLREGVLLGITGSDGKVLVPPTEYDPFTGEELIELVEVGPGGTVLTWAWVLVQPDGADVGFLQPVDAGSPDAMSTGMRVTPRWADEREGSIHDLACWELERDEAASGGAEESR